MCFIEAIVCSTRLVNEVSEPPSFRFAEEHNYAVNYKNGTLQCEAEKKTNHCDNLAFFTECTD